MTDTTTRPAPDPRRYCTPCAFGHHTGCMGTMSVMEPDTDPYRERTRLIWVQYPCSCKEADHGA